MPRRRSAEGETGELLVQPEKVAAEPLRSTAEGTSREDQAQREAFRVPSREQITPEKESRLIDFH